MVPPYHAPTSSRKPSFLETFYCTESPFLRLRNCVKTNTVSCFTVTWYRPRPRCRYRCRYRSRYRSRSGTGAGTGTGTGTGRFGRYWYLGSPRSGGIPQQEDRSRARRETLGGAAQSRFFCETTSRLGAPLPAGAASPD